MKVLIIIICFHLVPIRSLACISSVLKGGRRDVRMFEGEIKERVKNGEKTATYQQNENGQWPA